MKLARSLAIVCVLALLAGCSFAKSGEERKASKATEKYGDLDSFLVDGESPTPQPGQGSPSAPGSTPRRGSGGTGASSEEGATSGSSNESIYDDGALGSAGRPLLSSRAYNQIVIEVDWVQGREPDAQAVDYLAATLREITGKKVVLVGGNQIEARGGNYSGQAVLAASRQRAFRSADPKAAIWIGYLDGTMKGGGAAGVAVAGTVAAIFPDTFKDEPLPGSTIAAIERAVLLQEVGHLLGLVNIGYTSPRDHEDPNHPHHSKNTGSVMYWALMSEESLLTFIANGGKPSDKFDADDLADLKDLAAGRL